MHLLPTISLLLIITSITLVRIPKSFCQDRQFVTCGEAYRCGNISFTYPFWGGNRPNSCGYPGFAVSCQDDNIPRITVSQVAYRILASPNATANALTVARDDLWNQVCPTFLHNTTLNSSIFSYSNIESLTLLYGCNSLPPVVPPPHNLFNCSVNGTTTNSIFYAGSNVFSDPSSFQCNSSIIVPINQSNAQNVRDADSLRAALNAGFTLQYQAHNTDCNQCNESGGRCGYNTDSKLFACYCTDDMQRIGNICTQSGNGENQPFQRWRPLVIGLVGGIVFISSVALMCYLARRYSCWETVFYWKSDKGNNQLVQEFMRNYGSIAPKLYTYLEIKKITNSFADELGRGGYGCVYRGKLSDGRQVAVKVLSDNQGKGEDFINEVESFSRTSHVNVVTLLGFCYNRNKRALVFEFMPNGSLDKFIKAKGWSQDSTNVHLEWKLLYEIAVGIARGLEYLHRGCNTRIVHFDIKPHNILLDKDFCPKITDFGLAKLCDGKESIISMSGARGTLGYIAPEVFCRNFGGVSHKSDVYSYGMMVLEMSGLTRKLEIESQQTSENYFPNWIYERLELGKGLPLEGVMKEDEEETARKMIFVGLWCIQTNPADRPSISKVCRNAGGQP